MRSLNRALPSGATEDFSVPMKEYVCDINFPIDDFCCTQIDHYQILLDIPESACDVKCKCMSEAS